MPSNRSRAVFDAHPRPWRVIRVDSPSAGNGAWSRVVSAHGGIIASAPTLYAEVIVELVNLGSSLAPVGGRFELSTASAYEQHQLALECVSAASSETSRMAAVEHADRWGLAVAVLGWEEQARERWACLCCDGEA